MIKTGMMNKSLTGTATLLVLAVSCFFAIGQGKASWSRVKEVAEATGHYGGTGGQYTYVEQIEDGGVVEKIEAWSYRNSIAAIKLYFTNGNVQMVGDPADHKHFRAFTIDVKNGEYITELSVWGNGAGSRCGAFRIKTNKNREYHPKMWKWGLKTELERPVGSGIMLGFEGRTSGVINSCGFLMLRKVVRSHVEVTRFTRMHKLKPPSLVELETYELDNPTSRVDPHKEQFSRLRSTGGSFTISAGLTYGAKLSVSAAIPKVVTTGVEASWSASLTSSLTRDYATSDGKMTTISLPVPKFSSVTASVAYYTGDIPVLPFTGTMHFYLNNGIDFSHTVTGYYDGVSNSKFIQRILPTHRYDPVTNTYKAIPPARREPAVSVLNTENDA